MNPIAWPSQGLYLAACSVAGHAWSFNLFHHPRRRPCLHSRFTLLFRPAGSEMSGRVAGQQINWREPNFLGCEAITPTIRAIVDSLGGVKNEPATWASFKPRLFHKSRSSTVVSPLLWLEWGRNSSGAMKDCVRPLGSSILSKRCGICDGQQMKSGWLAPFRWLAAEKRFQWTRQPSAAWKLFLPVTPRTQETVWSIF